MKVSEVISDILHEIDDDGECYFNPKTLGLLISCGLAKRGITLVKSNKKKDGKSE